MSGTGGEIKSTLSLDVSQFATNLTKAIEGLDGLDKRLQSALKIAEGFDKGIAGIGTGMNSVAERFKMLDQTLSTLVSRMVGAADRVGSIGGKASAAAAGVERLGSAMKSANSMNADAWISKYEGKLNELAPAVRSTVQAILDLDRAKLASAEKSETASAKTTAARLKELEAEKRSNSQIIAERTALMKELEAVQRKVEGVAGDQRAEIARRYFGRNQNSTSKASLELRAEAEATEAIAAAVKNEIAALQSLVKEMRWKNLGIDQSVKALNAETKALEVRTKAEKDFAAAVKSSVNQAMQNPAGDYSLVRSGRIVPVQNPELLMNFPPRAEFDRAAQIAADNAAQAIRRAKSLVAIATANASGDYSTIGGKLKTVHNPEFLMNFPSRAEFEAHADKVAQDAAQAIRRAREMVKRATANAEGSYTDLSNYSTRFVANPRVDMMFPPRELFEQEQQRIRETANIARQAEAEKAAAAREAAAARRRAVEEAAAFERAQAQSLAQMWRSMGQLWVASKVEGGFKASVDSADKYQREILSVKSLNLPKEEIDYITKKAWDDSAVLKFASALDMVKARLAIMGGMPNVDQKTIDKLLPQMSMAANNIATITGDRSSAGFENMIRNISGVIESRGQTHNEAAAKSTIDLIQKIYLGTGKKIDIADVETFLRRDNLGANTISDEGLAKVVAFMDEAKVSGGHGQSGAGAGVSTVGTAVKMFQKMANGGLQTERSAREFAEAGLIDTSVATGKSGKAAMRALREAGLNVSEEANKDPVKAMQMIAENVFAYMSSDKNRKKYFGDNDVNSEEARRMAMRKFATETGWSTTAQSLLVTAGDADKMGRADAQAHRIMNAKGAEDMNSEVMKTYAGNIQQFNAALENLKITLGTNVLPLVTQLVGGLTNVVQAAQKFAADNPIATQMTMAAAAIGAVVMGVKGMAGMFGIFGSFSNVVKTFSGAMTGAGAATSSAGQVAASSGGMWSALTGTVRGHFDGVKGAWTDYLATTRTNVLAGNLAVQSGASGIGTGLKVVGSTVASTASLIGRSFLKMIPLVGTLVMAWDFAELLSHIKVGGKEIGEWMGKWLDDMVTGWDAAWLKIEEGWLRVKNVFTNQSAEISNVVARQRALGVEKEQRDQANGFSPNVEEQLKNRSAAKLALDKINSPNVDPITGKPWAPEPVAKPKEESPKESKPKKTRPAGEWTAPASSDAGKRHHREFEDAFAGKYQAAKSDLEVSRLEYNSALTGEDTFEARAKAEFEKMWQRGDFDDGKDPSKRKFTGGTKYDKAKGWSVDQIQWNEKVDIGNGQKASAEDFTKQIAERLRLADAIKAQTFANERASAADKEAQMAAERLVNGGIAKKTDAYRALEREFAREEERTRVLAKKDDGSYVDETAATAFLQKKKEALAAQAKADMANYAVDQIQRTKELNAELLDTERERLLAGQQATIEAEDAKWQAVYKTFQDQLETYDKDSEAYKKLLADKEAAELLHDKFMESLRKKQARDAETPLEKMVRDWSDTGKEIDQMVANWGNGMVDVIAKTINTGKLDWKSFTVSMLSDIQKMLIKDLFGGKIKEAFGGLGETLRDYMSNSKAWSFGPGNINDGKGGSANVMMKEAGQKALDMWNGAKDKAGTVLDDIGGGFRSMIDGVDRNFGGVFSSLGNWITSLFSMIGSSSSSSGLGGILGTVANLAIGYFTGGASTATTTATSVMGDVSTAGQFSANANSSFGSSGMKFSFDGSSIYTHAMGGIMSGDGPLSLKRYANGGIASSPQLAMFGEGMLHEAYVPLPDGRSIPVTINGTGGNVSTEKGGETNVTIQINVTGVEGDSKTSSSASDGSDAKDWKAMAEKVRQVVQQELVTQQRPGGSLYR